MQIICINFGVFMKNMKLKRRNTPSKEAVLAVLATSGKAMSQDAIEKKIKLAVDRATIYRILNRFCEDVILNKIVAEKGKLYYAIFVRLDDKESSDNHILF